MAFRDFPFPDETPLFPDRSELSPDFYMLHTSCGDEQEKATEIKEGFGRDNQEQKGEEEKG
jgi:hypothetical protein